MAGDLLNKFFIRSYILLKANFMFMLLTLAGGLFLGAGPALFTILSLFSDFGWERKGYQWKTAWQIYRANFRRINRFAVGHQLVSLLLLLNLYLAVSLKGFLFFSISLLILFLFVIWQFIWVYYIFYAMALSGDFRDTWQLSIQTLFGDGKKWLGQLLVIFLLMGTMIKFPAFGFFWGFAAIAFYLGNQLQKSVSQNQTMKKEVEQL